MNKTIITQLKTVATALVVAGCAIIPLSDAHAQAKSAGSGSSKASTATPSSTTTTTRGGNTPAVQQGKSEHKTFRQDMKDSGRRTEVRMSNIETKQGARPDAVTKSGRPVELKPDTASGRKAMENQLNRYENTMNKRGVGVYYDQNGGRRIERTQYSEWRARPESRPMRIAP